MRGHIDGGGLHHSGWLITCPHWAHHEAASTLLMVATSGKRSGPESDRHVMAPQRSGAHDAHLHASQCRSPSAGSREGSPGSALPRAVIAFHDLHRVGAQRHVFRPGGSVCKLVGFLYGPITVLELCYTRQ